MMKKKLLAGLSAAFIAVAGVSAANAAKSPCAGAQVCALKKVAHKKKSRSSKLHTVKRTKHVRVTQVRRLSGKRVTSQAALAAIPQGRGNVVAMIKAQAPRMGVPTWFALRIAHVESGYNPRARGRAGELGVFQMKCQTARGLGFRGNCGQLLNAATGVHWGLRHLQAAVRSSRGNLRLAASKHNGGLGRKSLVRGYVNRVF